MPDSAESRRRLRTETMIGIAGGKPICVCCGEKRSWALVFDHIHGGGTAHRRDSNTNVTIRLIRREWRATGFWPRDRYQLLCATCNHGRRVGDGLCPHTKEVRMSIQAINAIKSYVKVFAATVFGLFLSNGADLFAVDFSDLRTYVSAGVAAVLPLIITALDPNDDRFGVNA